jgi:hypothetical protein
VRLIIDSPYGTKEKCVNRQHFCFKTPFEDVIGGDLGINEREHNERRICPICSKEEDWSHTLRCKRTKFGGTGI